MSRTELIELLARVSLNVDEEIRMMAQQTMVNLIIESPAYRQRTIQAFIQFTQKYVPDTFPYQLDSCLKTLHTLLVNWKIALQRDAAVTTSLSEKSALVEAEGFALVMLCQCRPLARRLAVHILRESRAILRLIDQAAAQQQQGVGTETSHGESPQNIATSISAAASASNVAVIDILDNLAPAILERVLPILPQNERHELSSLQTVDFKSLAERSNPVWLCGIRQPSTWNHKPLLGSNNFSTPVAVTTADHSSSGNKVASSTMKHGGFDAASPSRTTRKSAQQLSTLRPSTFSQCLLTPYLLQPQLERTQLTDVWATALSVALSTSSALSQHPALFYAWNTVFHRMSQVFTLIDPSAQAAENRASSLLRSTSKKAPPTERDVLVPLWHNYVTLACCIAPSSTGVCIVDRKRPTYDTEGAASAIRRRNLHHISNPSTGSADIALLPSHEKAATQSDPKTPVQVQNPRQHQHLVNSKLFISAKEKARDLVKLIIPLLRCCDHPELRESVICGLSRIQPAAFRDVLEDLHPILRESIDLKQKNVQRRRRKDTLRSSLIRLLALMAQNATELTILLVFDFSEAGITTTQGTLLPTLIEFIEGTRVYFESLNEPSAMVVTMFGSSAGVGSITTVNHSSSNANDIPGGSSINPPTVGQNMNSPTGPSQSNVGTMNSATVSSGASMAGVSGSGAVSSTSGAQNPTANSASGPTSATAATSTAPAHAPSGVDPVLLTEMRLYFCVFVRDLIRHLPKERRQKLIPPTVRRNLVLLISRWSGFYEHIFNARDVKWAQPPWTDDSSSSLAQDAKQSSSIRSASVGASVGSLPSPPGMDQVISGDLVLSISGVHLESTPQAPFISASFLDASIWLELLWYANQSIAALICCGSIYEHVAIFSNPRIVETTEVASNATASSSHQLAGSSANLGGNQMLSNLSANLPNSATQPNSVPTTLLSNDDDVTAPTTQVVSTVSIATTNPSTVNASRGHPIPGYIFHWLKGLLLCRDAKLSISPWLWGLPVVNFGICSTALKGPHGKTGVRSIRLEDSLRSIVIAAAAGRRLDSLFRQLGEETFYILLDMNPDLPGLLELLIDQCYSGSLNVIQAFFVIIAQRFIKNPRMNCDRFTMLTLAMVFCEHPVPVIREHATFLLQTLYYRFFLLPSRELHQRMHSDCQKTVESVNEESRDSGDQTEFCLSALADELLWREIGHWKPCDVLRQFCAQHPTCTLPMISEICRRLATASKEVRCRLISLLHYWAINIELVDLFSRNYKSDGFMDFFHQHRNNPQLASASLLEKVELSNPVSAINAESESELEIDDRMEKTQNGVGGDEEEIIKCPSGPSGSESSSSSTSLSSSSESSHNSSISSDIDSSDCDGPVLINNMASSASASRKPRAGRRQHQDNRRRRLQQGRTSDQFLKPDQDGEKQKEAANELWASVPLTLRRSGWGCLEATEMVLNNFFYLTIRFANEPNESVVLGDLWVLMIRYRPSNLRYILRYLIVAASLAPATLCSHVNRVVSFLSNEDPSEVVEILMTELQTIDGAGLVIEPSPLPPFFHISLISQTNLTEPSSDQIGDPDENASRRILENESCLGQQTGSSIRPLSTISATGGDLQVIPIKPGVDSSPAQPISTSANTSAISRLTNRFASSASAMGRRALRTALHPGSGGGRQSKNSMNLDQEQPPELDIDSLDGEGEEESGNLRQAADTMPTPQSHSTPSADALVTARSQTLPYTAASRERYSKQTIVGLDNQVVLSNRPSRFRKILSRRRTGGGGRRNPFRSIFGGGGGGGGSGSIVGGALNGSIKTSSELVQNISEETKLYTTSLPPNLASLQPLPLPLHSHSISHLNDFRKKRGGRRRRSSSASGRNHQHESRRHRRRRRRRNNTNEGGVMEDVADQHVKVAFYETSLMLQQPLPMPKDGSVYYAPMRNWLTEPFVSNGSLVYSGMWSPTGARSPLVLLLVGEILKSHNKNRVTWRKHMPLLLLCLFLGLDHCRPLVQEESKQLLVNMLRVICPRIDLLQILSLQLEIDSQWIARAVAGFSTHVPQLFLILDDGPSVVRNRRDF
ncbi:unnamed protein product [Rodentolepis nana]|uniref:MOR2-PAG1_N domain-containing protein n=1 Tax=Rodentolepis nana TaxID=102285 RepID=A0A0R3TKY6_RODNA|nr:unnamed protein product [Rodentolepis nana]